MHSVWFCFPKILHRCCRKINKCCIPNPPWSFSKLALFWKAHSKLWLWARPGNVFKDGIWFFFFIFGATVLCPVLSSARGCWKCLIQSTGEGRAQCLAVKIRWVICNCTGGNRCQNCCQICRKGPDKRKKNIITLDSILLMYWSIPRVSVNWGLN